MHQKIKTL